MTRETRIGLLMGLAFIVMFGLVLSELTGTGSPRSPVSSGTALKELQQRDWPPPVIEPDSPGPSSGVSLAASGAAASEQDAAAEPMVRSNIVAPYRRARAGVVEVQLRDGPQPRRRQERKVTVRPNDNLIKIARRVYGSGHERQYKRIFAANRNILSDESTLLPGQVLVIPPLAGAGQTAPARKAGESPSSAEGRLRYRTMDLAQLQKRFSPARQTPTGKSGRLYVVRVVRRGDTLSGIARHVLKDDSRSAVMKIYKANRDKIPDPDVLPVGVKLRIPI